MNYLILENVSNHHNKGRVCHSFPGLMEALTAEKTELAFPHPCLRAKALAFPCHRNFTPRKKGWEASDSSHPSTSTLEEEVLFRGAGHGCEGLLSLSPQLTRTAETFTSREASWEDPEATAFTQSPVYKADTALGEGTQGRHPPLQRDSTQKIYTDLCINVHNIINHNGCRCLVAKSSPTCLHPIDCMQPARLLCPWARPGKSTGVGSEIEPTSSALANIFCTTEPPGKSDQNSPKVQTLQISIDLWINNNNKNKNPWYIHAMDIIQA